MTDYPDTTTEPTEHTRQSAAADHCELSDAQVAYRGVMVGRNDLDAVPKQYETRNRLLKLSAQLWDLRKASSARISELLRFNNEFEERARKAERANAEMFDLGFRAAGGQVLPIIKVDGVVTEESMAVLRAAWAAMTGIKRVRFEDAVREVTEVACGCGVNCQDLGVEGGCRYFTKPLDHATK